MREKDSARKYTDKELEEMEKKLREIYKRAEKELTEKANDYFKRFAKNDEKKRQLVAEGKLSKEKYLEWRKRRVFVGRHWTNMKKQASLNLHNVNQIATDYINGRLPDIYSTVYNTRANEIADVIPELAGSEYGKSIPKVSFEVVSPKVVEIMSTANGKHVGSNFLPYKILKPTDIQWNMKKINSEVLQGLLQGESFPKIADRLVKVCNNNEVAAMRTARTIVNTVENMARHIVAHDAQDMGCVMVHMWDSSHDGRVRDWHAEADNDYGAESQAIPIDEDFIVMGEHMPYPGYSGGSPENVYNCRCAEITMVTGFKSILPKHLQGAIEVKD